MAKGLSCRISLQRRTPGRSSREGRGDPEACARITCWGKTPMARKAAWSYCRRCLAVMLCCVLAFGFAVPTAPRAKANAAVEAVTIVGAGGGSAGAVALGSNPVGATICGLLLAVVGVDFAAGYFEHDSTKYYSDGVYKLGGQCWDYLYNLGGDIADWCINRSSSDVLPGSSFDVPPEVLEAVRQWAVGNMSFVDGVLPYNQYVLQGDFGVVALFNVDFSAINNYSGSLAKEFGLPILGAGTTFGYPALDYTQNQSVSYLIGDKAYLSVNYTVSHNSSQYSGILSGSICGYSMSGGSFTRDSLSVLSESVSSYIGSIPRLGIAYNPSKNLYYGGAVLGDGKFWTKTSSKVGATEAPSTISALFTETSVLEEENVAPIAVTVPSSAPTTTVGDLTIPVFGDLTAGDLTGEKEDENNKPGTVTAPWDKVLDGLDGINDKVGALSGEIAGAVSGAMSDALADSMAGVIAKADAQQQMVENSIADPTGIGSAFTTRFPFSIPWDIVKAIKLLAVPPEVPHWEIDLFAPMDGKWGFQSDGTGIVIDFERLEPLAVVTRWVSTVMFIYGLASATKRFIWPA